MVFSSTDLARPRAKYQSNRFLHPGYGDDKGEEGETRFVGGRHVHSLPSTPEEHLPFLSQHGTVFIDDRGLAGPLEGLFLRWASRFHLSGGGGGGRKGKEEKIVGEIASCTLE